MPHEDIAQEKYRERQKNTRIQTPSLRKKRSDQADFLLIGIFLAESLRLGTVIVKIPFLKSASAFEVFATSGSAMVL